MSKGRGAEQRRIREAVEAARDRHHFRWSVWLNLNEIAQAIGYRLPLSESRRGSLNRAANSAAKAGEVHINHSSPTLRSELRAGTLLVCAVPSATLTQRRDQDVTENRTDTVREVVTAQLRKLASDEQLVEAETWLTTRKSNGHLAAPRQFRTPYKDREQGGPLRFSSPDELPGLNARRDEDYRATGKRIKLAYETFTSPVEVTVGYSADAATHEGECITCHKTREVRTSTNECAPCFAKGNEGRRRAILGRLMQDVKPGSSPSRSDWATGPVRGARGGFLRSESFLTIETPRELDSKPTRSAARTWSDIRLTDAERELQAVAYRERHRDEFGLGDDELEIIDGVEITPALPADRDDWIYYNQDELPEWETLLIDRGELDEDWRFDDHRQRWIWSGSSEPPPWWNRPPPEPDSCTRQGCGEQVVRTGFHPNGEQWAACATHLCNNPNCRRRPWYVNKRRLCRRCYEYANEHNGKQRPRHLCDRD